MPSVFSSTFRSTPYWLNFLYTGQLFTTSHRYTVPSGGNVYLQGSTGSERLVHILSRTMTVSSGGPIHVELLEEPSFTPGATPPETLSNMDRRSSKVSDFQVFVDPTEISGGTVIDTDHIPTEGGPRATGALVVGVAERLLRPNTTYILRFTNEGSQNSDLHVTVLWYESGN